MSLGRIARLAGGLVAVVVALFAFNGLNRSWETPEVGATRHAAVPARATLRIMTFNVAKLGFHEGGLSFASSVDVRERIERVSRVLEEHDVDVAFLSEVVFDSGVTSVNQVAEIAEAAGFSAWAYGDNYSWGLPGLRIRSGNAILSRVPLRVDRVIQLAGDASFVNPSNNRRALLAAIQLGDAWVPCASIRNDSFDLENNVRQVDQLLDAMEGGEWIVGGDFNAEPHDRAMTRWREGMASRGVFDGDPTFPASAPTRRIDSVLVPTSFARIVSHEVLDVDLSDHEPVLVVVEL